jgi:hypothetical protein
LKEVRDQDLIVNPNRRTGHALPLSLIPLARRKANPVPMGKTPESRDYLALLSRQVSQGRTVRCAFRHVTRHMDPGAGPGNTSDLSADTERQTIQEDSDEGAARTRETLPLGTAIAIQR